MAFLIAMFTTTLSLHWFAKTGLSIFVLHYSNELTPFFRFCSTLSPILCNCTLIVFGVTLQSCRLFLPCSLCVGSFCHGPNTPPGVVDDLPCRGVTWFSSQLTPTLQMPTFRAMSLFFISKTVGSSTIIEDTEVPKATKASWPF